MSQKQLSHSFAFCKIFAETGLGVILYPVGGIRDNNVNTWQCSAVGNVSVLSADAVRECCVWTANMSALDSSLVIFSGGMHRVEISLSLCHRASRCDYSAVISRWGERTKSIQDKIPPDRIPLSKGHT